MEQKLNMQNMCSFQPPDHRQYHSAPGDYRQSQHSPRMDCSSNCSNHSGVSSEYHLLGAASNFNLNDFSHQPSFEIQGQVTGLQETLEPRMMYRHQIPLLYDEPLMYPSYAPTSGMYDCNTSPYESVLLHHEVSTPQDQYLPLELTHSPIDSDTTSSTPRSKYTEDSDDVPMDKPYARLIYDALMQASDHRMSLKDIYKWFENNTNKPHESGTNGWQNSIRHNLSMNQAFENDKTESLTQGQPRKSNSIWILTDHAVRHGVQSTTRYRKSGTSKKGSSGRIPATERQKSGSKGGKAARRAAQLRRLEQSLQGSTSHDSVPIPDLSEATWHEHSASSSDHASTPSYRSTASADDCHYAPAFDLSRASYNFEHPLLCLKQEHSVLDDSAQPHDYLSAPIYDDMPKSQYGGPSSMMFV